MRKPTRAKKAHSRKSDAMVRRAVAASKKSQGLQRGAEKMTEQLMHLFAGVPRDVVAAIKADHDVLRNFIKVLKDADQPMAARKRAYRSFTSLLKSHALAEEQVLYKTGQKLVGRDLHVKVAEGYVEHQLADQLMMRIDKAKVPLAWTAHVNVLAEIVEHHLDEEERSLLPMMRDKVSAVADGEMLDFYVQKRAQSQKDKGPKNRGVLKR